MPDVKKKRPKSKKSSYKVIKTEEKEFVVVPKEEYLDNYIMDDY